MEWNVVKIDETSGKNTPFVSIGRGQLIFNAFACNLLNDDGKYKYAQLLTAKENGKPVVAVKFLEKFENDTLQIKRKESKGKTIQGMTIANKGVIEKLFGKEGENDGMIRHKVELIDVNMLKIID